MNSDRGSSGSTAAFMESLEGVTDCQMEDAQKPLLCSSADRLAGFSAVMTPRTRRCVGISEGHHEVAFEGTYGWLALIGPSSEELCGDGCVAGSGVLL
ncbi:MAG: hypothetical protein ACJAV2_002881 [Myxococcota bacterium]